LAVTKMLGQEVQLQVTFYTMRTGLPVPADPTTITFRYHRPDSTTGVATFGVDTTVVRDGIGSYHLDLLLDAVGLWTVRVTGTGTVTAPAEQQIIVTSLY